MVKLRLILILFVIQISCGKKVDYNSLSDSSNINQNLTGIRGGNSILSVVVTPPDPPVIIPADLTVASQGGTDIIVATASEYNALEPKDQIYYTGLRNSIQYLVQDPANLATTLLFNADGSYSIVVNSDASASAGGDSCTVCGLTSAYKCKDKVSKYMDDNHLTTITATIKKVKVDGDNCIRIVYKSYEPGEPVINYEGTLVESYAPSGDPVITFPYSEFDSYIQAVKIWGGTYQGGGIPVSDPSQWSRQELMYYINEFKNDLTHPVLIHQNDADFQTQLEYYVNNIMTGI